ESGKIPVGPSQAELTHARLATTPEEQSAGALSFPQVEFQREPDWTPIRLFQEWTEQWQAADAQGRSDIIAEGWELAKKRRPEMKALIVTDPQRALEQAVPRVIRQDLPDKITAELET